VVGGEGQEGIPEEVKVVFKLLYYFVDVFRVVAIVVVSVAVATVVVVVAVVIVVVVVGVVFIVITVFTFRSD
jgi:hypothetical protein